MATNTSVLSYGTLLQLGNGIIGAGASQTSTITFGAAPTVGQFTISFWGLTTAPIVTTSQPTAVVVQNALNALFGTTYLNPFTVALAGQVYTVTVAGGPFDFMPLPAFTFPTNTSLQTIVSAITVPGSTKETYTTVAGVETMPFPAPKADVEAYVTYDTGNNQYKSKMKKFKDAGQVSMVLVFRNDAQQNNLTGLQSLFESASAFDWRVAVPTKAANPTQTTPGYTDYFTAFLTTFQTTGTTADARLKVNATLDIDGAVTRFPTLV